MFLLPNIRCYSRRYVGLDSSCGRLPGMFSFGACGCREVSVCNETGSRVGALSSDLRLLPSLWHTRGNASSHLDLG